VSGTARATICAGAAALLALALASASPGGAVTPPRAGPVPSLEPAATAELWQQLTRSPRPLQSGAPGCRPLRAVFYAASDWLRLATKLAAAGSPCAEHFISIPPLVADKTRPRADQAWRVRALGPRFHALAEIHLAAWAQWVAATGGTWYEAGVEARRRMAAAGYDVARGDAWAVNELSSAVRRGDGSARADALAFLRGLYEGEGAPVRGAVFVVGIGQGTADLSTYKGFLERWLADAEFWSEASAYVSDWGQEVYGDYRRHAVPGAALAVRREALHDLLQHPLLLSGAGPEAAAAARTYLQAAYTPLASAAWRWESGFGWTAIEAEEMKHYLSAQVYAMRAFADTGAQAPPDRAGFAWAPRNSAGLAPGEFAARSGELLDRLAAALRDSGEPLDAADPGIGACGPPGENRWCGGELAGAAFNQAWRLLRIWGRPALAFATEPQNLTAGVASAPLAVELRTSAGLPQVTPAPIDVSLSTSSPRGGFSTSAEGPWTPTLTVTVPGGASASQPFHYLDLQAGSATVMAAVSGADTGSQAQAVAPAGLASLSLSPPEVTLAPGAGALFTALGADAYGNPVPVASVAWTLLEGTPGTLSAADGNPVTFIAGAATGAGAVVATTEGGLSASAAVTVAEAAPPSEAPAPPPPPEPPAPSPPPPNAPAIPPPASSAPLTPPRSAAVALAPLSIGKPRLLGRRVLVELVLPRRARVSLALWRSGTRLVLSTRTFAAGRRVAALTLPRKLAPGRLTLVTSVRGQGLARTARAGLRLRA
jgi:hypothetical protein